VISKSDAPSSGMIHCGIVTPWCILHCGVSYTEKSPFSGVRYTGVAFAKKMKANTVLKGTIPKISEQ